jgi:hypothetical protein
MVGVRGPIPLGSIEERRYRRLRKERAVKALFFYLAIKKRPYWAS